MTDTRLDAATLALPIDGRGLTGATFGAELAAGEGPQLVELLRHFG